MTHAQETVQVDLHKKLTRLSSFIAASFFVYEFLDCVSRVLCFESTSAYIITISIIINNTHTHSMVHENQ